MDNKLEFIITESRNEHNTLIKEVRKYKDKLPPETYNKILTLGIQTYKFQPYYPLLYYLASNFEIAYQKNHLKQEGGEKNKMATIKEEAQAYEPPQTLNIADLEKIPIGLELKDGVGKDKDGVDFKYKYTVIEGKQYRIAGSILGGIKAILQKMPDLKFVTVIKQGSGMNTRYQVIPYTQQTEVVKPV